MIKPDFDPSAPLPPLRQELTLNQGSPSAEGNPTWVLQDPAANRFFHLNWAAFEMLSRWHLSQANDIIHSINSTTTLNIQQSDLEALLLFLRQHHLLQVCSPEDTARLCHHTSVSKPGGLKWLLHHYLFFRIPLVRPTRFLNACAPVFALVFTPSFWLIVGALLILGVLLVSRQWDSFLHTFSAYSGLEGLLGIGLALSFAKILHELGHALTARHYGCRVPTMGVAFLVMLPLLYTDTTDAWKLSSRRQRMHIGAAGMLAELVLAVLATLAWSFLPDGPLRAGVFLLATSTWVITLAINASPFMRFDGYFLLADWLNLPNLHERSFAMGRWWLREWLFGFNDPPPESFPAPRQRFLIIFAFATAIYRAVLFLSIALLVYNLFFKLLGILLMMVELAWFIAYPIQRELKVWWQRQASLQWNRKTLRSSLLLALLIAIVGVPWKTSLQVPAVIGAEQTQGIYASNACQVAEDGLAQGTQVKAGQVLVTLQSPDLNFRLKLAETKAQHLRWQLEQQPLIGSPQGNALQKRWEGAQEAVTGLQDRIRQLTITAPFDGIIVERSPALTTGTWIANGEKLFQILSPGGIKGEAYLTEAQLLQVRAALDTNAAALNTAFIANQSQFPKLKCVLDQIDPFNLNQLEHLYVASEYGGAIPSQTTSAGNTHPLKTTFRVRFNHCQEGQHSASLTQELAGIANLQGESRSFLGRGVNHLTAVWRSEAGF